LSSSRSNRSFIELTLEIIESSASYRTSTYFDTFRCTWSLHKIAERASCPQPCPEEEDVHVHVHVRSSNPREVRARSARRRRRTRPTVTSTRQAERSVSSWTCITIVPCTSLVLLASSVHIVTGLVPALRDAPPAPHHHTKNGVPNAVCDWRPPLRGLLGSAPSPR
jgi:xanthine/CO dehydrogenase XdhC/CoxF family maturation factor